MVGVFCGVKLENSPGTVDRKLMNGFWDKKKFKKNLVDLKIILDSVWLCHTHGGVSITFAIHYSDSPSGISMVKKNKNN